MQYLRSGMMKTACNLKEDNIGAEEEEKEEAGECEKYTASRTAVVQDRLTNQVRFSLLFSLRRHGDLIASHTYHVSTTVEEHALCI